MREIKFRSYNSDEGEFDHFDLLGEFDDHAYWMLGTDNVEQYTGLKDKNGVEIYEGDIIAFGDDDIFEPRVGMYGEVGHVVYDYDSAKYVVVLCKSSRNVSLAEHLLFSDRHTCRVVIGNIHQHPHLLEK